jgi:heterogeneous nuclear rnp K-like protein 2
MSASPQPTHSTKRPLEDTSSPSVADQPDAKRPALDKMVRDDEEVQEPISGSNGDAAPAAPEVPAPAPTSEANGTSKTNGEKPEVKDAQGDTVVPDAPETKPITSTASVTQQSGPPPGAHDETAWIHVRAVISSPEAATIIGKGGENVSKIRQMSGAKCTVSDYQKGAVERILTVSGIVDAVAKVRRGNPPLVSKY